MTTKQYHFSMSIPPEHYRNSPAAQPSVIVVYKIWIGGIITIEWLQFAPNVPENIIDWEGLYKLIVAAAKNNSEGKEQPRGRYMKPYNPTPHDDLILEQHNNLKK